MSKTTWALDPTHSELQFKVKHLMITTVTGSFKTFTATVETEGDDFGSAKIDFSAEVASIDSGNEQRDGHLKSADFFEVEKYPALTFSSTKLEKKDEENYILHGDLTIKGISKPVSITTEFGGIAKDPWGNIKAGFTLNGKINRKDWELNWNAPIEAGGVLVSEEVKIIAEIQVVKQA
jgi:polyisoprenoid-binding protein YceI